VFAIRLPPLRERREDILPLAEAFLAEFGEHFGRPPVGFSDAAKRMLLEHSWPGNVRELRNSLERAAILCEGGLITPEHLAFPKSRGLAVPLSAGSESVSETSNRRRSPGPPASSGDLESSERAIIAQALERSRFNKSKAAKALGLTRHQLYVRLRRYGLE
jgi:DNA-binding NtrC family response regulator